MLKKAISFSVIILIMFLVYQAAVNFLKREHSISYSVGDENVFKINEDFVSGRDGTYYLFDVVSPDKKEFVFQFPNKFNKQKKVVKEVKEYKNDGWYCLSLILSNESDSTIPLCMKDNVTYSYGYVKSLIDLEPFISKLPNNAANEKNEKDESIVETSESPTIVNKGYFDDDEIVLVYNYKRVVLYNKENEKVINFANQDNYTNTLGALVGNYYLIPRYDNESEVNKYIRYDVSNDIKKDLILSTPISKEFSYINGIYENKLYIFDKNSLVQYALDPITEEFNVVGNIDEFPFALINGEETKISVFEMKDKETKFSLNNDAYKNIDYDNIYNNGEYAIYSKNGDYYKVYEKYNKVPIFLFHSENAKEVKEKKGNVYYIDGDTIYKCNDDGVYPLVKSNEFIYNSTNIFDVYYDD